MQNTVTSQLLTFYNSLLYLNYLPLVKDLNILVTLSVLRLFYILNASNIANSDGQIVS